MTAIEDITQETNRPRHREVWVGLVSNQMSAIGAKRTFVSAPQNGLGLWISIDGSSSAGGGWFACQWLWF
jgi:hypothetical protein